VDKVSAAAQTDSYDFFLICGILWNFHNNFLKKEPDDFLKAYNFIFLKQRLGSRDYFKFLKKISPKFGYFKV
jgi:hypothetical protein